MKVDIESIKRPKNIFIFADETNNLYEIDIKNYNKLLINSISKILFVRLTLNCEFSRCNVRFNNWQI